MLYFIKLGGSLITNKNKPHTARTRVIARLAAEMAEARRVDPDLQMVVGHGSGSFGHVAGNKYHTRQGVHTPAEWLGFSEVWQAARALNQIVAEALYKAGLPVIAFPPSAALLAQNGQVTRWDIQPIRAALSAGLVPLVNGDVAFDTLLGGTILSTEDLFVYLARLLRPQRILLAGLEKGVWADYPVCSQLIDHHHAPVLSRVGRQPGRLGSRRRDRRDGGESNEHAGPGRPGARNAGVSFFREPARAGAAGAVRRSARNVDCSGVKLKVEVNYVIYA